MSKQTLPRRGLIVALSILAGVYLFTRLPGCSQGPTVDPGELNLRRIGQAYGLAMYPQKPPPKNVEELKPFFKECGDLREPEVILKSPRDREDYVILFGAPLDADAANTILAYEKKGKDRKRYVLTQSRVVNVLTDAEFAAASFVKGHKPTP